MHVNQPVYGEVASCPHCEGEIQREVDEFVCVDCDAVVEQEPLVRDRISRDGRVGSDENYTPTGSTTTNAHHTKGLGSNLDGDSSLERTQRHTNADRDLEYALTRIKGSVADLSLPAHVEEEACTLYRRARKDGQIQGRSIDDVAAACVRIASVEKEVPRQFHVVGEFTDVEEGKIKTMSRKLRSALDLGVGDPDPAGYIPRIVNKLGLDQYAERAACRAVDSCEEPNRAPSSVAAAAVYVAVKSGHGDATMKEVSEAANVSCPTIRKASQAMQAAT